MNGLPHILARREFADGVELDLHVAADCPWFAGHFPGRPILPGVVQIGWAAHFAGEWMACAEPPMVLDRVKFKHPIGADARLMLRLTRRGDSVSYEYLLAHAEKLISASSGCLCHAGCGAHES